MTKVYCAYDEMVAIEKVIGNPRNPNRHPEKQVELLAKIIKGNGWRQPITVSKRSGFVVKGHGRLAAAQKLGVDVVPVDYQEYANEAEEYADMIADNRIAELAEIDSPMLKDLLEELDTGAFDMERTGFDEEALELLMTASAEDDADNFDVDAEVEKIKEPISTPGTVWRLGRHRLMCGDATNIENVKQLMDGETAEMVFTDPPYNVAYEGGTKDKLKIKNDNMPDEQFRSFLFDSFASMLSVTKQGGAIYVCHADSEGYNFRGAMKDAGWQTKQCLVWVKNSLVLGRQDYQWRHEPILYGWKPGAGHRWHGGRKRSTVIDKTDNVVVNQEGKDYLITITQNGEAVTIKTEKYEVIDGQETSSVWRFNKPLRNGEHPTMKPVGLIIRAIKNSSRSGDIVLDLFGGSGSTLIACEQAGRVCRTMELDPIYCDVIVKRWEELTGEMAARLDE